MSIIPNTRPVGISINYKKYAIKIIPANTVFLNGNIHNMNIIIGIIITNK